ncbi:hypothetical protein TH2_127 [Shewanella phage Thanatos-2]|nr:hypothetical protein TH2_127 [Shewanella phage Thanatos-2]
MDCNTLSKLSNHQIMTILSHKALKIIKAKINNKNYPSSGICFTFVDVIHQLYDKLDLSIPTQDYLNIFNSFLAEASGTKYAFSIKPPKDFMTSTTLHYNDQLLTPESNIPPNSKIDVWCGDHTIGNRECLTLNSYDESYQQILNRVAYKVLPKWKGEYGESRIIILDKLIEMFKSKLIEENLTDYVLF